MIAEEKIRIGLLVPLTGKYSEIGQSIIKSTRLAVNKINNSSIEIFPRDTKSNPSETLNVAKELGELGIKIIIGPVFNENQIYLDEYYWDYSVTTGKYRNQVLCENIKETRKKIDSGEYILTNLN